MKEVLLPSFLLKPLGKFTYWLLLADNSRISPESVPPFGKVPLNPLPL